MSRVTLAMPFAGLTPNIRTPATSGMLGTVHGTGVAGPA